MLQDCGRFRVRCKLSLKRCRKYLNAQLLVSRMSLVPQIEHNRAIPVFKKLFTGPCCRRLQCVNESCLRKVATVNDKARASLARICTYASTLCIRVRCWALGTASCLPKHVGADQARFDLMELSRVELLLSMSRAIALTFEVSPGLSWAHFCKSSASR